jgi:hypothetical protein
MKNRYYIKLGNVIENNKSLTQDHLGELVRGTVEADSVYSARKHMVLSPCNY